MNFKFTYCGGKATGGLVQQKYLQKQGCTMLHQLGASISSGSGSTFNVQLLFLTSTIYFQLGICTGQDKQ